jgi:hypothetical protein
LSVVIWTDACCTCLVLDQGIPPDTTTVDVANMLKYFNITFLKYHEECARIKRKLLNTSSKFFYVTFKIFVMLTPATDIPTIHQNNLTCYFIRIKRHRNIISYKRMSESAETLFLNQNHELHSELSEDN